MVVHGGFLQAFESLRPALDAALERAPAECELLLVGHSMGGALATLAAATLWERSPRLITFGAPATGNAPFAAHVNRHATPGGGGLRVWNRADVIVTIALAAGYRHCGLSMPGVVRAGAIAAYERARGGEPLPGLALAAPHVLHQLGSNVYTFPVLWSDMRRRAARTAPAQPLAGASALPDKLRDGQGAGAPPVDGDRAARGDRAV